MHKEEKGIINLDDEIGRGTHWVAYKKKNGIIEYFDSYGDLKPPIEVVRYFSSNRASDIIQYNYQRYQDIGSVNCGHLSLLFLKGIIK